MKNTSMAVEKNAKKDKPLTTE